MLSREYSFGRSLNKDWIRSSDKGFESNSERPKTPKGNPRAKSAASTRSQKSYIFIDESEDEIYDTVKEFKLTLQLFKRLTQQVRDVNDYMNSHKIYSFKHQINNDGIMTPALRRSQLAAALSRREIPATGGPHEPINDLGPPNVIKRSSSRQGREMRSPSPVCRSPSPSQTPPTRPAFCIPRCPPSAKSPTDMEKKREIMLREADEEAKEEWVENDEDFEQLFVPEEMEPEDPDFRFHDPYPRTWVDEEVEDACFRGSKKVDPFMHRLAELEDVQEETVLWEKLKEEKARQTLINSQSKNRVAGSKSSRSTSSVGRSQSAKTAPSLMRRKSQGNKLNRGSSARNNSLTSHLVSGDESDIVTFRKSGYNMDVSFILGSMFPETRPKDKKPTEPEDNATGNHPKRVISAPASTSRNNHDSIPPAKDPRLVRPAYCEACRLRKSSTSKHSCRKSTIPTLHALRTKYALKATECYDIVELARTLDLPCKEQMNKAKSKPKIRSEEKATKKGLEPGKSNSSQRRISLTAEGMAIRGINPAIKVSHPSKDRYKSDKKSAKRR